MRLLKPVIRGIITYVPPLERRFVKRTRGTDSARYCYSVWLRHLAMARRSGLDTDPQRVAELGPGDSIGIGLAALLSGAASYTALDIVAYTDTGRNLAVFDELVALFRARAPIPDADEFPEVKPYLPSYEFPGDVLDDPRLARTLDPERVRALRDELSGGTGDRIVYCTPWYRDEVIEPDSADMIFSQAVLEHVDDLPTTYAALARWLKPGGFASHEIGFVSHKITPEWNGHWTIPGPVWKLIRGRRPYLLNREPASTHVGLIRASGLEIVGESPVRVKSDIDRAQLVEPFTMMSDDDLTTKALFVQAVKG